MTDFQQVLQLIASRLRQSSRRSINSQEIAKQLGVELLDVEMLLHRMQDAGDIELDLIRNQEGFAFVIKKITNQGRAKLKK